MQVQVNTGNGLENKESLERWASDYLNGELGRFSGEIPTLVVQLTDEARGKHNSVDMRCMLEARLAGHQPIAVNHHAENMDEAIRGAAHKLIHALEHTLGKLAAR